MSKYQFRNKQPSKKVKNLLIACSIIFGIILVFWLFFHIFLGFGNFKGRSYDSYQKRATSSTCFYKDIPAQAEDFRYEINNLGLGEDAAIAFTLHGQEYNEFIKNVADNYHGEINAYTYNKKLDYTGLKVSETTNIYNDYNDYIGFPTTKFDYVIDDNIMDYTILYYDYYKGSDIETKTIATNLETGRIVIYDYECN